MIRPRTDVEPGTFVARPVGLAETWPGMVAFLDGTQRYEVMSYASNTPVVVAEVAAAIMERRERRLQLALEGRRRLVIARPAVLQIAGRSARRARDGGIARRPPAHPVQEFQLARRIVDQARGRLEVEAGASLPGALGRVAHRGWVAQPRARSGPGSAHALIAKSHATLPFEGEDLRAVPAHAGRESLTDFCSGRQRDRTGLFLGTAAVALEGKATSMHGLIRVEAAPTVRRLATVDRAVALVAGRARTGQYAGCPVGSPASRDSGGRGVSQVERRALDREKPV